MNGGFDDPGAKDGGDIAAKPQAKGDEAFPVQADGVHEPVHDKGRPRHVTAAFQKSNEEHHGEYNGDEYDNIADPCDNPVSDKGCCPSRRMY